MHVSINVLLLLEQKFFLLSGDTQIILQFLELGRENADNLGLLLVLFSKSLDLLFKLFFFFFGTFTLSAAHLLIELLDLEVLSVQQSLLFECLLLKSIDVNIIKLK